MRNVSFIIGVNMNCIMFYMKFDNVNIKYYIFEICIRFMFFNFKGVSFLFLFENVLVIIFNGVKSKFMLFICMGIVVGFVYY